MRNLELFVNVYYCGRVGIAVQSIISKRGTPTSEVSSDPFEHSLKNTTLQTIIMAGILRIITFNLRHEEVVS